mgnify:CR=1 FL=1
MQPNVGSTDRLVRGVVGLLLVAAGAVELADLYSVADGTAGLAAGAVALLVGLVLLGTAAVRSCPAYSLLGWNTIPRRP